MGRIGIGIGIPVQGRASAAVTLVKDTFTGADGTALSAHVPDARPAGSQWTIQSTDFTLSGNQLVAGAGAATYWDTIDSGKSDVTVAADLTFTAGGALNGDNTGLVARFLSTTNYWVFQQFWGVGALVRITEIFGGVGTVRASGTFDFTAGVTFRCAFVVSGNVLAAVINGATVLTWTSPDMATQTGVGFRSALGAGQNHFVIDNLLVTAP